MFNQIFGRMLQLTGTIAGVFKEALPYPPSLSDWPKYVIIGAWSFSILCIRPNQRWSKIFCIISLIIGFTCGFIYWVLIDSTTIEIDGKVYIRGELTEQAKEHMKKHPSVSEKEYLIDSGREEDWIWTPESRKKNRIILGLLYSSFIFFSGIGFLGALEKYARSNTQPTNDTQQTEQVTEQGSQAEPETTEKE
jgi:hypothetical protein